MTMTDSQLIHNFSQTRILCLGDIMLDEFVMGSVSRISPEAPVPVIHVRDETLVLGGAGNVIRNFEALGCSVSFISVLGEDGNGHRIENLLNQLPRVKAHLFWDKTRITTTKTRFLAGNQQVLRTDREQTYPLDAALESKILSSFQELISDHDLIVLSDYAKGFFSTELLRAFIDLAQIHNKQILIDPKGKDFIRYKGANLLTPNKQELSLASPITIKTEEDLISASRYLLEKAKLQALIITRGSEGMTLVDTSGNVEHIQTQALEVFDVSGAGDTVIATIAACIAAGSSLPTAMRIANAAAGLVVAKIGTAVVHQDELISTLHTLETQVHEQKIVAWEKAENKIQKWKRQGQKIIFTNGCFDLLHPGHISLLNKAKQSGDKLIIGLNTDASVQRLKGPERPIQKEYDRAFVLSSLHCVDLIVLFDEDTPLKLIEFLKPDILVKGADYTIDQIVGAPFVQSYGGQVLLIDLVEGKSTTNMVTKLRT